MSLKLDSFTIKYDIEDLLPREKQTENDDHDTNQANRTNCICHKMARLFSDLLTQSSNTSMVSHIENSGSQTELRHIYKEIKLLRKYQFDLNNKFNLLIDKLDSQMGSNQADKSVTAPITALNKTIKQETKVQMNLTGAKKRKFNSVKTYVQDPPRSASVTSSSSSETSSSSHTSSTTEIHNQEHIETESPFIIHENQEDSNPDLAEIDVYQDNEELPDYELENYDEQKNFKYPIGFPQRFSNFKYPIQAFQNMSQTLNQTNAAQKNVLNTSINQTYDLDLNELFKGNGPKYLQLESYANFKPPIVFQNDKYFIEDSMAALSYSKSKSRRNFAAHLTKLVFTPRERLESNCNGRFGKKALDSVRLMAIRNTIFKYYPCKQSTVILNGDKITSGDHDENSVWVRDCIPAIDESNRVLKKQLVAWYKKNNPSILIRHNGGSQQQQQQQQQHMPHQSLSPSTSSSANYSASFLHSSSIDECNEAFDEVDEC